ncbi:MAG: hypothetical protein GC165_07535 [Armatimonadetes bacterium]|nr:hypothetical protein [Armatimonadota bacterium]
MLAKFVEFLIIKYKAIIERFRTKGVSRETLNSKALFEALETVDPFERKLIDALLRKGLEEFAKYVKQRTLSNEVIHCMEFEFFRQVFGVLMKSEASCQAMMENPEEGFRAIIRKSFAECSKKHRVS